jgi:hypothetical protein
LKTSLNEMLFVFKDGSEIGRNVFVVVADERKGLSAEMGHFISLVLSMDITEFQGRQSIAISETPRISMS